MWQRRMLVDVFGWPADTPIPTAPPWQALKEFGGHMSVTQWREAPFKLKMRLRKAPLCRSRSSPRARSSGRRPSRPGSTAGPAPPRKQESLEQQATQHGASFSLKNLARPPEAEVIKTTAQLRERHPELAAAASAESEFQEFLDTLAALPTEEECRLVREKREAERKANRKRKRNQGRRADQPGSGVA